MICNIYLSVAAGKIVFADPSLRCTIACCWDVKQPTNNNQTNTQVMPVQHLRLICNIYLSVAAGTIVFADPSLRCTIACCWDVKQPTNNNQTSTQVMPVQHLRLICNIYLSVAAGTIVFADPSLRCTIACCWDVKQPTNNNQTSTQFMPVQHLRLICNIYLSVAAGKIVFADPSLRCTIACCWDLSNQQTTIKQARRSCLCSIYSPKCAV